MLEGGLIVELPRAALQAPGRDRAPNMRSGFILQPIMATNAALYDGVEDARTGRAPYLWAIASKPAERGGGLREGLISTARVILLGLCMDAVYQFIEFDAFHPAEAVIIALLLAFVPYLLLPALAHRSLAGGTAPHRRTKSSEGAFIRLSLSRAQWSPGFLHELTVRIRGVN